MLASTVMFVRVLVVVALVRPQLVGAVAPPMVGAALGGAAASAALWLRARSARPERSAIVFSNPFELGSALRFALLFAIVLVGSKAATVYLGTSGTYAAGVLAGSTDVDAITLSMAKLAGDSRLPPGGGDHDLPRRGVEHGREGRHGGDRRWLRFGRLVIAGQLAALAAGGAGVAIAWLV